MFFIFKNSKEKRQIFNIGQTDKGIKVSQIAEIVTSLFEQPINIKYGISNKGWIGDVPKFNYKISKLQNLGWTPKKLKKKQFKP